MEDIRSYMNDIIRNRQKPKKITKDNITYISGLRDKSYVESIFTYYIDNMFYLSFVRKSDKNMTFLMSSQKHIHSINLKFDDDLHQGTVLLVGVPGKDVIVIYDIFQLYGKKCDEYLINKLEIIKYILHKICEFQCITHKCHKILYGSVYPQGYWKKNNYLIYVTPCFYVQTVAQIPTEWSYNVAGLLWKPMFLNSDRPILNDLYWLFRGDTIKFFISDQTKENNVNKSDILSNFSQYRLMSPTTYKMFTIENHNLTHFFSNIKTPNKIQKSVVASCFWDHIDCSWKIENIYEHTCLTKTRTNMKLLAELIDGVDFRDIKKIFDVNQVIGNKY